LPVEARVDKERSIVYQCTMQSGKLQDNVDSLSKRVQD